MNSARTEKSKNGESGLVCPLRRPVVRDRRRGAACAFFKARRVPFGTTAAESVCWQVGPHPLTPGGRGVSGAARDQLSRQPFPGRLVVPPRGSGKERAFRGPAASGPGRGSRAFEPRPLCFFDNLGPQRKVEDVGNMALNWELDNSKKHLGDPSAHQTYGVGWGFEERNRSFLKSELDTLYFLRKRLRSPPGSSVRGILQARILELVAVFSSRGFSRPRDRTSCIGRQILYH